MIRDVDDLSEEQDRLSQKSRMKGNWGVGIVGIGFVGEIRALNRVLLVVIVAERVDRPTATIGSSHARFRSRPGSPPMGAPVFLPVGKKKEV